MSVEQFLKKYISQWGDRQVYSIDASEIPTILSLGGKVTSNIDNKDGTFSLTIHLQGKDFICITLEDTSAT